MGLLYRARQFWNTLRSVPTTERLARASQVLSPSLMELFLKQPPAERAHSLDVFLRLAEQGENSPDLLTAALLHDVGKSRFPLRPWERAAVVIGKAIFPDRVEKWGESDPRGPKRPFVVAAQHARWGAEMAESAGASALAASLIRRHQDPTADESFQCADSEIRGVEKSMLQKLQLVDNES